MFWDQPWECFWDDPDDQWLICLAEALNRTEFRLTAKAVIEQNGIVVVDKVPLQMKRIRADQPTVMVCPFPNPTLGSHTVTLVPWGDAPWPLRETYPEDVQSIFADDKALYREVTLTPTLEYFVFIDDELDTQLSSFDLTGVVRYWTGIISNELKTRLTLWVTVTTDAGIHTVSIYTESDKTYLLARGTITGDGTVTLTAQDANIVLSGTAALAYTGDFEGTLLVRYPIQFKLYVDDELHSTVDMDRRLNNVTALLGPFEVGMHTFKAKMLSDDGELSDYGTPETETIPGPPAPCLDLHYVSGNYLNTVIAWTVSTTVGATTNIYDSVLDAPPVMETPAFNAALATQQLDPIPAGAGIRRVVIDATHGGIESGFRCIVDIEYDEDGEVVAVRPNVPAFSFLPFGLSNQLRVRYTYCRGDEKTQATGVRLYVTHDPSTYVFGAGQASASLTAPDTSNPANGVQQSGVLTYSLPSANEYYWLVRSIDANGVLSENTNWAGPIFATPVAPPAPALSLRAV